MISRIPLALAVVAALGSLFAFACGGGAASDPRCGAVCAVSEPPLAGAGDVCSQASADACKQECGARLSGVTSVCGDCLLQDAHLGGSAVGGVSDICNTSPMCANGALCTRMGRTGSCTYCEHDMAAQQACEVKVDPRREVPCTTEFRDPAKCSALCAIR